MSDFDLPHHIFNACETIDAAIFTGTLTHDVGRVNEMMEYVERWRRELGAAAADFASKLSEEIDDET